MNVTEFSRQIKEYIMSDQFLDQLMQEVQNLTKQYQNQEMRIMFNNTIKVSSTTDFFYIITKVSEGLSKCLKITNILMVPVFTQVLDSSPHDFQFALPLPLANSSR